MPIAGCFESKLDFFSQSVSEFLIRTQLRHVAIGKYLRTLYTLQLEDDILLIAKDDILGRELQDIALINRKRASKK